MEESSLIQDERIIPDTILQHGEGNYSIDVLNEISTFTERPSTTCSNFTIRWNKTQKSFLPLQMNNKSAFGKRSKCMKSIQKQIPIKKEIVIEGGSLPLLQADGNLKDDKDQVDAIESSNQKIQPINLAKPPVKVQLSCDTLDTFLLSVHDSEAIEHKVDVAESCLHFLKSNLEMELFSVTTGIESRMLFVVRELEECLTVLDHHRSLYSSLVCRGQDKIFHSPVQ